MSSELVVISTKMMEDGQGVMVKIQTWSGENSIRYHYSNEYEYEYEYMDFLIYTISIIFH